MVAGINPLKGVSEDYVLSRAAAAEKYSEHPLARAVLKAIEQRGLIIAEPGSFNNIPGQGVEAVVNDKSIFVGAVTTEERPVERHLNPLKSEPGVKTLIVTENNLIIGEIYIKDSMRPGVADLIKSLKGSGFERIQMLTGDEYGVAAHVAGASGYGW